MNISPAHAGITDISADFALECKDQPRACGDEPPPQAVKPAADIHQPRACGDEPPSKLPPLSCRRISPAHAGMNRIVEGRRRIFEASAPRMRG